MKRFFLQLTIAFVFGAFLSVFFYWPMHQNIKLDNSISDINTEIKRLNLPLGDELKEVLDRYAQVPINRHQLCFENNNRVYLIHSDSDRVGITFHTDDIGRTGFATTSKIGAMTAELYYSDNFAKDEIYREIGQPKLCITLDMKKIQHYASSTAFYHHAALSRTDEIDLGSQGKLIIGRIIGQSYIDTDSSHLYVMPRWYLFLLTLVTITSLFYWLVGKVSKLFLKENP